MDDILLEAALEVAFQVAARLVDRCAAGIQVLVGGAEADVLAPGVLQSQGIAVLAVERQDDGTVRIGDRRTIVGEAGGDAPQRIEPTSSPTTR